MDEQKQVIQTSERYLTGALLALTGGFLDAYTYISRGGIFANAQTGNMVLMGINLAEKNWKHAGFYLIPVLAFFLGVLIAEVIKRHLREGNRRLHWRQWIIGIEVVILLAVAFFPQNSWNTAANVLVSFVCALQVESFRKVNGNAFATTMCTGNLRSATEKLYHYTQTKDRKLLRSSLEYYGIIAIFIFGAGLGAVLTQLWGISAVLCTEIGLIAVFILMFQESLEK